MQPGTYFVPRIVHRARSSTQTGKKISPATAASLIADATRIETVLGC